MPSASKWPPPAMRGAKSASHITQSHLSAKNHTNLIDIPHTNYYQMILRIIWSNAQVIYWGGGHSEFRETLFLPYRSRPYK